MIIAVDFDGTIVEHKYPAIGKEIPFAFETLRKLQTEHRKAYLQAGVSNTLPLQADKESIQRMDEAVTFCRERGLEFYAVNRDYPEEEKNLNNHFSRKLKADIFIDDRNLGGLPDWGMIYEMVSKRLSYEDLMRKYESEYEPEKPKGLFSRLFR